ncbi:helix-turn-helix transcriptional regulator [Streptomyces sp. NRRL S-646]|uniref:helix-turn-helix transcriptional regulator n=1 Tax=Streptomyces sp. NRRL S-646 TaxID=1463917 RepID=UPI0004CC8D22|nr:helix-turn-helix transcriptional regulator [Streptomyces sp. NRRL S-646]
MQYLTDWRMVLAREHLRTGELGMAGIARSVGYSSPDAFAAAFRRHHGEPPGAWRHNESRRVTRNTGRTVPTSTDTPDPGYLPDAGL